ncbi:MAG: hypothetical protein HRU19_18620 [Pseudobacteriovorax sp.]|nr:hypothetical protein [Pseudobacteriovorax sp.]
MVKSKSWQIFLFVTFLVSISGVGFSKADAPSFLIPANQNPKSIDPLDAMYVRNLPLMKMLYRAPIEIDQKGQFNSTLLADFSYDYNKQTMTWTVAPQQSFANGKPIRGEDIVLALKRVLLHEPNRPVLSAIVGQKEWIKTPYPLKEDLKGLKLDSKTQRITILFREPIANPFYEFRRPLYSVMPADCINLLTNKLSCETPSFSGYYRLAKNIDLPSLLKKGDGEVDHIEFLLAENKRFRSIYQFKMPKSLIFQYYIGSRGLIQMAKVSHEDTVFQVPDYQLTPQVRSSLEKDFVYRRLPQVRIWHLTLDPKTPAFSTAACRRVFRDAYVKEYWKKISENETKSLSLATAIMPGYLTNSELKGSLPANLPPCDPKLLRTPIKHSIFSIGPQYSFWDQILMNTLSSLQLPRSGISLITDPEKVHLASNAFDTSYFVFGIFDIHASFKDFFSAPNYTPITAIAEDSEIKDITDRVFRSQDDSLKKELLIKLNKKLYRDAYITSLSHWGLVIGSRNKKISQVKYSTSELGPWFLFPK